MGGKKKFNPVGASFSYLMTPTPSFGLLTLFFYLPANLVISHCLHVLAINKTRDENPESKSWLNYIYDDTLISTLRQHQCVVPDSGLLYVVRRVIFALKKDPYTSVLCLYFE